LTPAALAGSVDGDLAGRIAESIVGAYLVTTMGADQVHHFPERADEPEVHFVLTSGAQRIPIEVKYRRGVDPHRDTRGLVSFIDRAHYHAPFGILVTQTDGTQIADSRIVALPLSSLLMLRS
jgi:predicted AAA+ superfamily ATPase